MLRCATKFGQVVKIELENTRPAKKSLHGSKWKNWNAATICKGSSTLKILWTCETGYCLGYVELLETNHYKDNPFKSLLSPEACGPVSFAPMGAAARKREAATWDISIYVARCTTQKRVTVSMSLFFFKLLKHGLGWYCIKMTLFLSKVMAIANTKVVQVSGLKKI